MGAVARAASPVPERQGQRDLSLREGEVDPSRRSPLVLRAPTAGGYARRRARECASRPQPTCAPRLQPEIKFPDQLVVVELVGGAAFEGDLAVDDDVTAVGDAQRLREVLLRHQHGELVLVLELLDLV